MQSFSFFFSSLECPWQASMQAVLHLKVAKMAKKLIFSISGAVLLPFVSLAPSDAEFLGAALADAPVFSLPGCRAWCVLAAAAAFVAQAMCAGCAASFVTRTWTNFGVGTLRVMAPYSVLYLEETRMWHMYI